MSLAMTFEVDQAEAALRQHLTPYPGLAADLRENPRSQHVAQNIAVDVLAVIQELHEATVEDRLDAVTARLLAWYRIAER